MNINKSLVLVALLIPAMALAGTEVALTPASLNQPIASSKTNTVVPSVVASPTMSELDKLASDQMLLEARLKSAESRLKIMEKEKSIRNLEKTFGGVSQAGMPSVKSIEGIGSRLVATLVFPEGFEFEGVAGDVLPNGMKILFIRPSNVTLQNGKSQLRLGFLSTPSPYNSQQNTMNPNGVPGQFSVPGVN